MRVLMVSDVYPPLIGGMEKEVQTLSEGLSKKGHNVIVCTINHSPFSSIKQENGVKVYRIEGIFQRIRHFHHSSERKFHPPIADWLVMRKLKRAIETEAPDLIHAHGWMLYSVLPVNKRYKAPLIVTFHDYGFICPCRMSTIYPGGVCDNPLTSFSQCLDCERNYYSYVKSLSAYLGVRLNKAFVCDAIVYTNPNIVGRMSHLQSRKIYLEHPIETNRYKPIKVDRYEDRILCWAKLDKIKGIDIIFEVARNLPQYQFDIPFIGEDKDHYRTIRPRNVNLLPRLLPEEIPKLINKYPLIMGQFTIGVFGLSELEAMSCGKPVVAYWNRKYDVLYEDPCPILSSTNASEIVKLIKLNIGNESLGKLNREWILRTHSTAIVVDKLVDIYNGLLEA